MSSGTFFKTYSTHFSQLCLFSIFSGATIYYVCMLFCCTRFDFYGTTAAPVLSSSKYQPMLVAAALSHLLFTSFSSPLISPRNQCSRQR